MKKRITSLALLSFAINPFFACAALPEAIEVYDIPSPYFANEYSAGLLVLRPGGSNDYAVLVSPFNPAVAAPILSPSWEPKGIDAHFSAGFTLNYRHLFTNTNNDVNFSWVHLNTTDTNTFPVNRQPPPAQQMAGPFWSIGPDAGTTTTANGELTNHYDVVSVELGKHIILFSDIKTRLFAGVSGLWLNQKIEGDFTGADFTFFISSKSKFSAAGMRFGIDGEYPTWCGFSVIGMIASSLFVGSQQPLTESFGTGTVLSNAGIPTNHQTINHKRYIQTVTAFDGKLGVKYTTIYKNNKLIVVEGGYMTSIFVDAIQNYVPSTFVPASQGIATGSFFLQSLMKTTDSFSVDGPYLTFTIKI